ncbi:hypothetical protein HJC23_002879 [Cyclotella cryptica]|uniref:Uncharacterized protein n=1 Tax=Cyclotella cryptica TaxID=29204 RepID=A0ABD3PJC9_9STRA|eukprot:CCRYP_013829-RA/>CCRYP_013829-RA protein AED:0.30 eAED:0.30 QI:0/-1/0/1/-1/1/1/0/191
MPTIHYVQLSEIEKAGIEMTPMENRYAREIIQETGIPPTRDQIHDYIEKSQLDEWVPTNVPREMKCSSSAPSIFLKKPIFVKNGNKQELHDAWELIGPDVEKRRGYVWIEWGISGLKEFVLESDVVRGGLPSRTRKKTDRYMDRKEEDKKQPARKKTKLSPPPAANSHFVPIKDSGDTSVNDVAGSNAGKA